MNRRTSVDPLQYEHDEFERQLLGSAAGDGPSAEQTERAWLTFAAEVGALSAGAGALATVVGQPGASRAPALRVARAWYQTPRAQAVKWLLLGALSGGGLAALWLPSRSPTASAPVEPASVEPAPAVTAVPVPSVAPAAMPVPSVAPAAVPPAGPMLSGHESPAPRGVAPRATRPAPRARESAPPGVRESQLAREVAALDAARAALAIGAGASALRQIERYHRDFPAGELSADADVIAIEALALEGDGATLERAAREFLQRHPRDPHVARIRELAARGETAR